MLIRDEKQREVQILQHLGAIAFYASKQPYAGDNYIAGTSNYVAGPSNYLAGPSKQSFSGQKFTLDRKLGAE